MSEDQKQNTKMSDFGAFLFGMMTDMNKEFARQFQKQDGEQSGGGSIGRTFLPDLGGNPRGEGHRLIDYKEGS